jgi:hypothetical protein
MSRDPMFDDNGGTPAGNLARDQESPDVSGLREPEWALSPAFRAEIERRLEAHRLDPDGGETWEVAEAEVLRYLAQDKASAA